MLAPAREVTVRVAKTNVSFNPSAFDLSIGV
jgi:hypothetical protein